MNIEKHSVSGMRFGTCPNIETDIDVTERIPFFIRPYRVKEEDERILDKEMGRLCYLGILKEGYQLTQAW